MGLSFNRNNTGFIQTNFSSSPTSDWLTTENIKSLNELGFTVIDNGYTTRRYTTWTSVQWDGMRKGISHPQTLRLIEIRE